MSSFADSLGDFEYSQRKIHEWDINMALYELESARKQKDDMDVSGYVESIRSLTESGGVSFADIGTSEEELSQLSQIGYKSEARMCLELARQMYGYSRLHLYARAVRNIGQCFLKEPNFHWLKSFLAVVFCIRSRHTRQYYIAYAKEYLTKANLSLSDIGTDEVELVKLGS